MAGQGWAGLPTLCAPVLCDLCVGELMISYVPRCELLHGRLPISVPPPRPALVSLHLLESRLTNKAVNSSESSRRKSSSGFPQTSLT